MYTCTVILTCIERKKVQTFNFALKKHQSASLCLEIKERSWHVIGTEADFASSSDRHLGGASHRGFFPFPVSISFPKLYQTNKWSQTLMENRLGVVLEKENGPPHPPQN